jgi:hypothetical protein
VSYLSAATGGLWYANIQKRKICLLLIGNKVATPEGQSLAGESTWAKFSKKTMCIRLFAVGLLSLLS